MKTKLPIITIDGPAGVGKSTLAASLAGKLGIPALDTGAMFRSVALRLGPESLEMGDEELQTKTAGYSFSLRQKNGRWILFCDNVPVGNEIRNEKVAALASAYATKPSIRGALLNAQRQIAAATPLVAEGRDMGTAVFPNAAYKFYLDADPEARAFRRWLELGKPGGEAGLASLEEEIRQRDIQDKTRHTAPLACAADAIKIDATRLDASEVLRLALSHIDPADFASR